MSYLESVGLPEAPSGAPLPLPLGWIPKGASPWTLEGGSDLWTISRHIYPLPLPAPIWPKCRSAPLPP